MMIWSKYDPLGYNLIYKLCGYIDRGFKPHFRRIESLYIAISSFLHICSTVKAGTLILDSSTIDPLVSKSVSELAEAKGAVYMDAPVSGGKIYPINLYLLMIRI